MKATSTLAGLWLVASALAAGGAAAAPYTPIEVLEPPVCGGSLWDGERMRGARERVKDILPGRRD